MNTNTNFKSALDQIHADPLLIDKTERAMIEVMNGERKSRYKILPMRIILATVCLMLIITGSSFGAFKYYKTPICYLSIEINPSIELGINVFGTVISSKAFNEDGALILDEVKTNGQTVENSVKALISAAIEKGYIAADGSTVILLTTEVKSENKNQMGRLEKNSQMGLALALKEKDKTAILQQESVTLKLREEADLYGISVGKYNLIQKLQNLNGDIVIENYLDLGIKEILFQIKENAQYSNQPSNGGNGSKTNSQETTLQEGSSEQNIEQNAEQNTEQNKEHFAEENTEQNTEQNFNGKSTEWNKSNSQIETLEEMTEETIEEITTSEELTSEELTSEELTSVEKPTTNSNGEGITHDTTNERGVESTSEKPDTSGAPITTGSDNGNGKNQ